MYPLSNRKPPNVKAQYELRILDSSDFSLVKFIFRYFSKDLRYSIDVPVPIGIRPEFQSYWMCARKAATGLLNRYLQEAIVHVMAYFCSLLSHCHKPPSPFIPPLLKKQYSTSGYPTLATSSILKSKKHLLRIWRLGCCKPFSILAEFVLLMHLIRFPFPDEQEK